MAIEGHSRRLCVPENYDLGDEESVKLLPTDSRNLSNQKSRQFRSSNGARDLISPSRERSNSIIKKPNQKKICGNRRKRRICESDSDEYWDDDKEKQGQLVAKSCNQETQIADMNNQRRPKRHCVSSTKHWEENFTLEDFQYDEEDIYSVINTSNGGCDLLPKTQRSDSVATKANNTLKGAKRRKYGSLTNISRAPSSDTETTKIQRVLKGAEGENHGPSGHSSSNLCSSSSRSLSSSSDSLSIDHGIKAVHRPAAKDIKVSSLNLSFRDLSMLLSEDFA